MAKENIPVIDLSNLCDLGQTDVLIRRFGEYLQQHQKNLHPPHRHSFYHIVYFTRGSGSHTIDFERFPVLPNQIYFMVPGQVHAWNFEGDVDGFVVNFTNSFFHSFLHRADYLDTFSFFSGTASDGVTDLADAEGGPVKVLLEKTLAQFLLSKPHKWDMIRILLLELFILIDQNKTQHKTEPAPHHNATLVKKYLRLIDKNYLSLRLPKEYADLMHITPGHLNAICKDYAGVSAGELIRNRIILEARRLLVNLDMSVSQVGYLLNFHDNSYFTRFFKKYTGLTPEEFRRQQSHT